MFMNNMSSLLNKIERRLGTAQLNLPDYLKKDKWADIIQEESLITFSRYMPNEMQYKINSVDDPKDSKGFYTIDESRLGTDVMVLGVKDIDWESFSSVNSYTYGGYNYSNFGEVYDLQTIGLSQMAADHASLFNQGVYVDFKYPNKIRIVTVAGIQILKNINIPIIIYTVHPANLSTISPTQMEIFENLCICDVASWLYNELKYYDQLETVYSNIELKMDVIQDQASKREDVISMLNENHVSTANANAPYMWLI